ncbi:MULTISPECIES: hypothetical protein [unclassified Gilliamella]|uniref:hypothetical protein n=1 Tax=unclassified Gilliamella TaxID=2685620 RepID=UPI001C40008B|nr:hypothetical protein [Gilliamella apicola]
MSSIQSIGGSNSIRPKLPSITGSRFWAAFLVFLFHASLPSDLAPFADPTVQHIYTVIVGKQVGWGYHISLFLVDLSWYGQQKTLIPSVIFTQGVLLKFIQHIS